MVRISDMVSKWSSSFASYASSSALQEPSLSSRSAPSSMYSGSIVISFRGWCPPFRGGCWLDPVTILGLFFPIVLLTQRAVRIAHGSLPTLGAVLARRAGCMDSLPAGFASPLETPLADEVTGHSETNKQGGKDEYCDCDCLFFENVHAC